MTVKGILYRPNIYLISKLIASSHAKCRVVVRGSYLAAGEGRIAWFSHTIKCGVNCVLLYWSDDNANHLRSKYQRSNYYWQLTRNGYTSAYSTTPHLISYL